MTDRAMGRFVDADEARESLMKVVLQLPKLTVEGRHYVTYQRLGTFRRRRSCV